MLLVGVENQAFAAKLSGSATNVLTGILESHKSERTSRVNPYLSRIWRERFEYT